RGGHGIVEPRVREGHGTNGGTLEDRWVELRDSRQLRALSGRPGRAKQLEQRHVKREVRGLDLSAPDQLAQDVHGVLALPRRHVRARELVEHVGEPRFAARDSGEVLPRLLAMPAEERAPGGVETASRAKEELRRLIELSARLKRRCRRGKAAGAAQEDRRLVIILELAVDRGRFLHLSRRGESLGRRLTIPAALVE